MMTESAFLEEARAIAGRYAGRFDLTYDDGEDCVQEFLIKWMPVRDDLPLLGWPDRERRRFLGGAAHSHCLLFVRRQRRGPEMEEISWRQLDPDPAHSPQARLFRQLFWEEVYRIGAGLAPDAWKLFVAHHLERERVVDMAAAMEGSNPNALRQSLFYGRTRFRELCLRRGLTEAEFRTYLPLCLAAL